MEVVTRLKADGIIEIVRNISRAEDVYIDPDNFVEDKKSIDTLNKEAWLDVSSTLAEMSGMASVFDKPEVAAVLEDYANREIPLSQDSFYIALDFFMKAMEGSTVIFLNDGMHTHYMQMYYFEVEVEDAFPSAGPDIQDCGSAYALGLYTSSVFHALRALEIPLVLIANKFGVTRFDNWNQALNQVEALVRDRDNSKKIPDWENTKDFYTDAINHLFAVKNAWRNYTMHNKLRFAQSEAELIIISVKAFMQKAAKVVQET